MSQKQILSHESQGKLENFKNDEKSILTARVSNLKNIYAQQNQKLFEKYQAEQELLNQQLNSEIQRENYQYELRIQQFMDELLQERYSQNDNSSTFISYQRSHKRIGDNSHENKSQKGKNQNKLNSSTLNMSIVSNNQEKNKSNQFYQALDISSLDRNTIQTKENTSVCYGSKKNFLEAMDELESLDGQSNNKENSQIQGNYQQKTKNPLQSIEKSKRIMQHQKNRSMTNNNFYQQLSSSQIQSKLQNTILNEQSFQKKLNSSSSSDDDNIQTNRMQKLKLQTIDQLKRNSKFIKSFKNLKSKIL